MSTKKAILIELDEDKYNELISNNNIVSIDFNVLSIKHKKKTIKSTYEVLDDSILEQYLITEHDKISDLNYHMKRQLTKLHKCLLEHKRLGFVKIKNFSYSHVNLSNRDLSNIDFSNANLSGANFRNSNLSNCDFGKANIRGADFTGANLTNAKLQLAIIGNFQGKNTVITDNKIKNNIFENNC